MLKYPLKIEKIIYHNVLLRKLNNYMTSRWIIAFILIAVVELYAFQAIKTITKSKWILMAYVIVSAAAILFIVYELMKFDRSVGQTKMSLITLGLLLLVLLPKLVLTFVMLMEDDKVMISIDYFHN